MNKIFRTSSDWNAFCLDNFPDVKARLTDGDRRQQIFFLFELVGGANVLERIQQEHGTALKKYEHLLRYRA
jgi:hypothetical protein